MRSTNSAGPVTLAFWGLSVQALALVVRGITGRADT